MRIANALWGQSGTLFQPSFLSTLSTGYGAPLEQVDFVGNPSGAVASINQWASTATQGLFPMVIQPADIDVDTRLVLVDAVYFKGTWTQGFDPSLTAPAPFYLADGTKVMVTTMTGTVDTTSGRSSGIALQAESTPVVFSMPKFSFTTQLSFAPVLGGMGMTDVFEPRVADLSGMDGAHDLYVAWVKQQAMVEVDESGTVAAALTATGAACAEIVVEPPSVTIDEPFIFLIRDTKSGSILFMGRVEDPRQG